MNKLKITSDGTPIGTKLTIDGVDVTDHCKSLAFKLDASDNAATVKLEMYVDEIDVEGPTEAFKVERKDIRDDH